MTDIIDRITDYLASGGLFNPELMNGPATRDLLIDCRTEIQRLRTETAPANEVCRECGTKRWLHNAMLHPFNPFDPS